MHPGILSLTGRTEEVEVGRMVIKGSSLAGHITIVPPLDLTFSIGSDSSKSRRYNEVPNLGLGPKWDHSPNLVPKSLNFACKSQISDPEV